MLTRCCANMVAGSPMQLNLGKDLDVERKDELADGSCDTPRAAS